MVVTTVLTDDGVSIALHDLGGSGPVALLAHATGFNADVLAPLAAGLGGAYSCSAPDLRGHGQSGAPRPPDFSWGGFALDVLATVDAIERRSADRGPVFGVGHSLGGAALLIAEALRPGTFAAIYCFEPILLPTELRRTAEVANPLSDGARRRRAIFASRAEALDRYRSRPPLSSLDPEVLFLYVEHGFEDAPGGTVRLRCKPEDEALIFAAGFESDALDHLEAVHCPVTIATGTSSGDLGRASASRIVAQLAGGRLVELDGLGHLGPLEAPLAVAGSVLDAFDGRSS